MILTGYSPAPLASRDHRMMDHILLALDSCSFFLNSTQQQAGPFLLICLLLSYLSDFLEVLPQSFHDSCTFSVLKTEENAFEAWGQRVSSWGTLSQLSHLSAQILKAEACLMTRPWSMSLQFEI